MSLNYLTTRRLHRHFYNFDLKIWTVALMELFIKIVNGIVTKHKKGKNSSCYCKIPNTEYRTRQTGLFGLKKISSQK